MASDRRRAVVAEGVVPTRLGRQLTHCFQVIDEQRTGHGHRRSEPIKEDVLITMIRPNADHVALVGRNVVELVLSKETEHGRVGLADLLSRFDRDGQVLSILELPTRDRMRDQR